MIAGNKEGIRNSVLEQMEELNSLGIERDEFCPLRLIEPLARYSALVGREIAVYIGRSGEVLHVAIGDLDRVELPDFRQRRSRDALSGVRCVHTHPGGAASPSMVDLQALRKLRFDAMVVIGVKEDGRPSAVSASFLGERVGEDQYDVITDGPYGIYQLPEARWMEEINEAQLRVGAAVKAVEQRQRAFLVGVGDSTEALNELESLAYTAGIQTVGRAVQSKQRVEPSTYIGKGKAQELCLEGQAADAGLFIFDDELNYTQMKNLEEILMRPVKDRTGLILDIFAMRAQSREGKLQVELARMKYELPRLQGLGVVMSRVGAGTGLHTRGAGETQLETDRRRLRRRIHAIEQEIKEMSVQRGVRRGRRERADLPVVALVGYTNAGKSTLLNTLSGTSDAYVEDKLFATLDPITRAIALPGGRNCLVVDTVGFISKLPHDLVAAFRSTLEEALVADLLVIVADGAAEDARRQHEAVLDVLGELGAGNTRRLVALNKTDLGAEGEPIAGALPISAKTGAGVDALLARIEEELAGRAESVELLVPYSAGNVLSFLHGHGRVQGEQYEEGGTRVTVELSRADRERVMRMLG